MPCNIPEEQRPQLHHNRSLKSHMNIIFPMTLFKSELLPWYYGHEPLGSMITVNFLDSLTNTHKVRSHTMESVSYRYSSNLNIITELKYEVLLAVTMNSMVSCEGTRCRL